MADATIVVEVIGDISKVNSALQQFENATRDTFSKLEGLGKTLSATVTAPLVGVGTAAINAAMDFNNAMANVAALIPENTQRVEELKSAVQSLSTDLGKSTNDLAKGLYEVISAFGDSEETMGRLEAAAKLARAGAADTVESIRMLAVVTKAYGDTSLETVQKVSDFALMTVKLGQTTLPELAGALDKVAPIASTLGVSLEELHTVFATLTGVTGDAAEVATQFRAILGEFLKPSKDLAKVIAEMGYESGPEFVKAMGGVVPAIKALYEHVNKDEAAFSALFGRIEGINAALALVGPQAETFSEKLKQMGQAAGFTEEAFKAQTQGINAAGFTWEQFKAKLQVFMQEVGDKLLPVLARFLDKISALFDWFSKLSPRLQNFLITLAGAAAASGPIMMAVGAIGQATSAFNTFASLFAAGGALGPYGLVAIGVGAVALLIYQNWDKIKEFLLNTWERIKSAAEAVWGGIKGFFTRLWDGLIEYHRTTMEAWHSLFSTAWERIRGVAETVWGNIKGFFLKIWDGLEAYHQASMEQTHNILSSIWEKTKGVAETIWGGIKSFFLRVWEGVNAYHEASMEQTNAILTTSWELIKRGAETVWGGIRSFFVGFWDNIKSKWGTAWSGIQGFLESTWESISEKATKAWNTIKEGAKSLWERLVGHSIIPDMVTAINEEFNRIDSSIAVKRMKTLEQKFSEISGASVVSAKQMVHELNGVFGSLNIAPATSEIEGFGMSFEASTDKVLRGALQMEEAFGRVINWNTQLKASFDSLEMSVERTTKSIDALMDKVLGVVSQIGNIVINMSFGERPTAGQVGGLLSNILNFFVGIPKWISTVLQTIFGWIDNYRKKLEELIKSVLGQMTGALKEFFEAPSLQQAINTFGERLKNIVYQMLVDAVVKAIVASEAVRRAAEALGKAINEAIKKATAGGVFNPQTFMSIAGPAINAFAQFWQNTMLPVLEQTFQALQPYNPLAGEPQYVTVRGTFTKSLDLGWVANTKKTTTVASIGDINININVAEGNPELIASQIWDELSFEARRRGVEWWP